VPRASARHRSRQADGLVVPKVHTADDLSYIVKLWSKHTSAPIRLIASIESAFALMQLGKIAASPGVEALLFAAEDFCADTSIRRTKHRRELLFARSSVVVAAKAHRLQAIDMVSSIHRLRWSRSLSGQVCINFKDPAVLAEEAAEGAELGFDGKQAIHPAQVEIIQTAFAPSSAGA
jgi:citrate lyase subunit beta-like protein